MSFDVDNRKAALGLVKLWRCALCFTKFLLRVSRQPNRPSGKMGKVEFGIIGLYPVLLVFFLSVLNYPFSKAKPAVCRLRRAGSLSCCA